MLFLKVASRGDVNDELLLEELLLLVPPQFRAGEATTGCCVAFHLRLWLCDVPKQFRDRGVWTLTESGFGDERA